MIATNVVAGTGKVVSSTTPVVWPAGMVTLAGAKTTARLELLSRTRAPPLGAAWVRTILALDGLPPITTAGFNPTRATLTVCFAELETPPVCETELPEKLPLEASGCALCPHPRSNHKPATRMHSQHSECFLKRTKRRKTSTSRITNLRTGGLTALSHGRLKDRKRPEVHDVGCWPPSLC